MYEEEISDSKEQVWALQLLSGTLLVIECFKEEEHGSLRSQLSLGQFLKRAILENKAHIELKSIIIVA